MANTYKIAGQAAPGANSDTLLYTVPDATQFVESTLTVCNRNVTGVMSTFRVAVVKAGEALSDKCYLAYNIPLEARAVQTLTLGFTLGAGDKVFVRSSSGDLSFGVFGCEIS